MSEDEWRKATGAAVRAEMGARNWSQRETYERAGMPRSTFIRIATGERSADLGQLSTVARAFGLTLGELVARIEYRRAELGDGHTQGSDDSH